MAAVNSPNSSKAFALDVPGFPPTDIVPDALILGTSTKAGVVEGDQPAVRVPYVDLTDDAGFVAEGAVITEADPDKSEVVIQTGKGAVLVRVSREVMAQGQACPACSPTASAARSSRRRTSPTSRR